MMSYYGMGREMGMHTVAPDWPYIRIILGQRRMFAPNEEMRKMKTKKVEGICGLCNDYE
jgi:hypothetical protein